MTTDELAALVRDLAANQELFAGSISMPRLISTAVRDSARQIVTAIDDAELFAEEMADDADPRHDVRLLEGMDP